MPSAASSGESFAVFSVESFPGLENIVRGSGES